jgi:hypothetical protein
MVAFDPTAPVAAQVIWQHAAQRNRPAPAKANPRSYRADPKLALAPAIGHSAMDLDRLGEWRNQVLRTSIAAEKGAACDHAEGE